MAAYFQKREFEFDWGTSSIGERGRGWDGAAFVLTNVGKASPPYV
jgi:hypothetical protein